ncbi:tetratricopeptide repeat protein 28 [Trichogramma pretiosum]|uniref:tetratricopeptide repeat protein 28 n=1 Tax=Trichogramma pretiosum TaxID=7493 RepID=UPI000C71BB49|nr:tetratricopeptide repeat protein 28 [Trichogramma pretiosum]
MSHRDISEIGTNACVYIARGVEPEGTSALDDESRVLFLDTVRRSNAACQAGDYGLAASLYTEALGLDPASHVLYSNRSAARLKMGMFALALQDAVRATELSPTWPKAYYRQGVALQCLGRYADALVAFSLGLAREPSNGQLLSGLIEATLKSPLRLNLEPTFQQLRAMKLDESPFVVVSVVGQELLGAGQYRASAHCLEAALAIGSCSLKLRGSVFSALSSAYWAMNSLDKAINYMQQDLEVARSLADVPGECRAHGNLGSAYFSKGSYKESLTAHRYQLVLAMKCKDGQAAAAALTSLGHVYTAIGDLPNALASHKQAVQLVKQQANDKLQEAREIGNVGAVYLAMGEFDSAVDCHTQHLRIARRLGDKVEEARAFSNLGSAHHYRRNYGQAAAYHENVLQLAHELGDKSVEARAYAGLGHAARCAGDLKSAKLWYQRQLDMALQTKDKVTESRSCSNLGIVYHLQGDHDAALKLHQAHLALARALGDRAGMGRAYGNIGNAYNALGYYEQACKYHKQELAISKEVNDRCSEASTHGNLGVAYQALQNWDAALRHYRAHLSIARELKDAQGEACALLNLGNCLSSRGRFDEAVPYYETYLMLSQELQDVEGEAKACHFLGYAHYCLGNYREAVRYYDQDLALAKDLQDKSGMGRAYCNLGLAHLALGNLDTALECQKYYLTIVHMTKQVSGKFRALGNIGDCLLRLGNHDEAIKMHQRQLQLARQSADRGLEATAYGALGAAHRATKSLDKALGYHTQELTLRQESGDLRGECRAHGNLGSVHMQLGQFTHALKCYREQLERARELGDSVVEAQALGNLGITRVNTGHYEEAIGYFEQQLLTLEPQTTQTAMLDKVQALGNLGDCFEALGDTHEAVKCHEQELNGAVQLRSLKDQERAYGGLGRAKEAAGQLQEALVCFEKRLLAAHEADSPCGRGAAYGDLGRIHAAMGNYEQSIGCLQHQLALARETGDKYAEAEAAAGLGAVHLLRGEPQAALQQHQAEYELAESLQAVGLQARACGNLAAVHEAQGRVDEAIRLHEKALSLAAAASGADLGQRASVFASLGRLHHLNGDLARALSYLQSGLSLAEGLGHAEETARLRHRLGLVHWDNGDWPGAAEQLEKAAALLEAQSPITGSSTSWCSARSSSPRLAQKPSKAELLGETYRALQRICVHLGKHEEALCWAERGRRGAKDDVAASVTELVDRQKALVLYFSELEDELHAWCLAPGRGLLRFHSSQLQAASLERRSQEARESVINAADQTNNNNNNNNNNLDAMNEDQIGNGSSATILPARNHHLNASSYSLSSLFSVGSVSSRAGSQRWTAAQQRGGGGLLEDCWHVLPAALQGLYELLIGPFEDLLPAPRKELVLVVERGLYLAPLPALRADVGEEYLCERFSLLVVPALGALKRRSSSARAPAGNAASTIAALVVGNPLLPEKVRDEHGWSESVASAETEAGIVAELLETRPLVGNEATRSALLRDLSDAECVHLTVPAFFGSSPALGLSPEQCDEPGDDPEYLIDPWRDLPKITARLVVISCSHWSHDSLDARGVERLARSFLLAGAQCVLIGMWPVPSTASSILLRAFYSAMLQGQRASRALAEAMQTVQHTRHFARPVNWAGWLLLGGDTRLSNKVALMGQALAELLRSGPEECRDALRVTLHLVEKSLQRINCGQKNAMYTTQKSIENKVGGAQGWRELLMSVGFRFEPAGNGIRPSVFFPQSDPEERLTRCSASLQALLGLGQASLHALVELLQSPEAAEDVIAAMRRASCASEGQEIKLPVRVWRTPGSHELFASLGFDLMEVGQLEVGLRTGKMVSRRSVQFALQALLALFDTQEAPKSLSLDSSSSMESLSSSTAAAAAAAAKSDHRLDRVRLGGAFACYVRARGEPDGKTMETTPSLSLSRLNLQTAHPNDNDTYSSPSVLSAEHPPPARLRNLFPDSKAAATSGLTRPGSSSSGSVTDWDSNLGHNTVLRRHHHHYQLPILPSRLSIRSELSSCSSGSSKKTGATSGSNSTQGSGSVAASTAPKRKALHHVPPSQQAINNGSNNAAATGQQTQTQSHRSLTNRTRDLTPSISDVYHERNLGLGLAPSLSKLLGEDGLGAAACGEEEAATAAIMVRNNIVVGHSQTTNWLQTEQEFHKRDEGDGRSITGSQCSQTSGSNKIRRKAPPPPL